MNMVDFDCMTPGHLQMLYVKCKHSTDVVASTKLGKQEYLVIWGFMLSLLTMFTEEVKSFLNNVIFFHSLFLHTFSVVHSHMS
jgi:hypothetical protein